MDDLVPRADALWRATTYISVAQLHLLANPLLAEPLTSAHVKERPSGHWGTVPGTAFVLSHIALVDAETETDVIPVLGAGHAGVVQLALAWITGDLARVRPQFSQDAVGLAELVASFPEVDGLGAEVSPHLPGGLYLGGQLGGGLAFAQGAALDAPGRVVVPVLGDGECETPTTAAAWLASRALPTHTAVLPIVHVNGFRMGGRSLLGGMDNDALHAYAVGLGWQPYIVDIRPADADQHVDFRVALTSAVAAVRNGQRTLIILRCVKGWSAPAEVIGAPAPGAGSVHKTPLTDLRRPDQLNALSAWLGSYRPAELFTDEGGVAGDLADAVDAIRRGRRGLPSSARLAVPRPVVNADRPVPAERSDSCVRFDSFPDAVTTVLRRHVGDDFRVFSPDELASNRLGGLVGEQWVTEVLAEKVLLGWLAGWTSTGRRGLLISYEAFAPLFTTGLVQLLKQRRLLAAPHQPPSLNLLLTSYGWHNTYTHGDPSLTTTMLASRDPAVRVITPADPSRLALALDRALGSDGQVNIIVAGKHPLVAHPLDTVAEENARGLAIWPHASDDGEPDLVLAALGDLPASVVCQATSVIRHSHGARLRVVYVQDLTVLGDPVTWPSGLTGAETRRYFGAEAPIVFVTLGHPTAVWGLIENRLRRPVELVGWREPAGPMPQNRLGAEAGMDVTGLCATAGRLLAAATDSGSPDGARGQCPGVVAQVDARPAATARRVSA